jgi:hypothetical protein
MAMIQTTQVRKSPEDLDIEGSLETEINGRYGE